MASHGNDPLSAASWHTAGKVCIDSGSLALGDPATYLSWKASGSLQPNTGSVTSVFEEKVVFFETVHDVDCPVEKGSFGDDVLAARVELLSDVSELKGLESSRIRSRWIAADA